MSYSQSQKITGIIIVMILVACTAWYFAQKMTIAPVSQNISGPCGKLTGTERTSCENRLKDSDNLTALVKSAADSLDPKLCSKVSPLAQDSCRDIAYLEKAMKSRNIKDCLLIKEAKKQMACRNNIAPETAIPKTTTPKK